MDLPNVAILDFTGDKDDGGSGENSSYNTCKAPVKSSLPTNQHLTFTGHTGFLLPNQQCQNTEENDTNDDLYSQRFTKHCLKQKLLVKL